MKLGDQWSTGIRPDAQAYDEIRITTDHAINKAASGDEWRISANVQLLRKEL